MRGYTRKLSCSIAVILAALLLLGCDPERPQKSASLEDFLQKKEAGLVGYGKYMFRYSHEDCQICVNKRRKHVRLQNDKQSYYVHVELSNFPNTIKEKLEVTLSYSLGGDQVNSIYNMEVMESKSDKIWLWDNKKHTGIILPVCW